jgi:hypothetical protein
MFRTLLLMVLAMAPGVRGESPRTHQMAAERVFLGRILSLYKKNGVRTPLAGATGVPGSSSGSGDGHHALGRSMEGTTGVSPRRALLQAATGKRAAALALHAEEATVHAYSACTLCVTVCLPNPKSTSMWLSR